MTGRQPLTARDRSDLLREIGAGKVTRAGSGDDWRATARFARVSGFGRSGSLLGRVRVSSKHLARLVEDGVVEMDGNQVWRLTAAGRDEVEGLPSPPTVDMTLSS